MTKVYNTKTKKKKEILEFLEFQKPLARKVASHYTTVGKMLGLKLKQLEDTSFAGAMGGYIKFLEKRADKKPKYKIATYLTWWMRRSLHVLIIKRVFLIAEKHPAKAEKILLELLE